MSQLPRNADSLIAMRTGDKPTVPELPVLISFVGPLEYHNLTLQATSGVKYNWHCIAGLDVEVFVSQALPFSAVLKQLAAIAAGVPKTMVLTFTEGPRVHCGEMRTVTDFAVFDWFPMVVTPERAAPANHIRAWTEGKVIEKQLWDEIGRALPVPYEKAMELVVEIARENQQ
jgi:hypothetical protein